MAINIESMSSGEIRELLAEIDSVQRKRSKRVAAVRAKIDAILKREGLSVEDVYAANGKRRGRPPGTTVKTKRVARKGGVKYRNPQNPDQTWTGHGKRPTWFKDALAAGAEAESLLANAAAAASKPARKAPRKAAKPAGGRKAAASARGARVAAKPAKTARKGPRGERRAKAAKADVAAA